MKISGFVLLSMIAVSLAIPSSTTEKLVHSANAVLKTESLTESYGYKNQSESNYPKSLYLIYFQNKLQALSDKVDSCFEKEEIDLSCYRSRKASILDFLEETKVSGLLSEDDKSMMNLLFRDIISYKLPSMQKQVEKKCIEPFHFTSECIYFNFDNYAAAVTIFNRYAVYSSKEVLSYDDLATGAQDLFLGFFKSENLQLQRLSAVSTSQWREKPGFKQAIQLLSDSKNIHNQSLSILKSKGIEI